MRFERSCLRPFISQVRAGGLHWGKLQSDIARPQPRVSVVMVEAIVTS